MHLPGVGYSIALRCLQLLHASVVLLGVDVGGRVILLMVHESLFVRRELAAIGFAHAVHFAVQPLLLLFQAGGFSGSQLAAFDALCNAILLVLLAFAHFAVAVVLGCGVVLVVVDAIREAILLIIQLGAINGGEVAVVLGPHRVLFLVESSFAGFQALGFARR